MLFKGTGYFFCFKYKIRLFKVRYQVNAVKYTTIVMTVFHLMFSVFLLKSIKSVILCNVVVCSNIFILQRVINIFYVLFLPKHGSDSRMYTQ